MLKATSEKSKNGGQKEWKQCKLTVTTKKGGFTPRVTQVEKNLLS